jgi:hypothetical protein
MTRLPSTQPPPEENVVASVRVPGFLPSSNGLHFNNYFPDEPDVVIDLGIVKIPIGNASNGLCGGMVFAVADYFSAGLAPPPDTSPPAGGSPLFNYLVKRIIDSYDLPSGPATYLALMSPAMPDGDDRLGPITIPGRASRMINHEWPAVKAELDAGRLCPLGLVKVKSVNPADLGVNHQVLAYGYDLDGGRLSLALYDPDSANDDGVTMVLDITHPSQPTAVTLTPVSSAVAAVYCFFRVEYQASVPPA